MKLWLDDERDPTQSAIQSLFYAEGNEIWVKTVAKAIEYLETGEVTSISLDHDLGYTDVGNTGYELAKWIECEAYNGTLPRLEWRLHTANAVGKKRMRQALENADRFWNK